MSNDITLTPSKNNLITKIDDNNYAVYNALSGAFDIADHNTVERFKKGQPKDSEENKYWLDRGYYFKSKIDRDIYISKRYQDFVDETNKNQIQFMLVLTYGCNFNCPYCYQKGIPQNKSITKELIKTFVDYVINYRDKTKKKVNITLFGGEPLLTGKEHISKVSYLVDLVSDAKINLTVVTNGYNLTEYIPILKKAEIKEIHISLDGDKEIHDTRRFIGKDKGSFDKIMEGIKLAVAEKFPIHIRLITDRMTLKTFPTLAKRVIDAGYLDLPKALFKTSLGRNYELINEYMKESDLFTIDDMYREYTELAVKEPIILKLFTPGYFGITHMIDTGEMYMPSFDTCPGGKSEFVFDHSGYIYSCTASCGRENYEIGEYKNGVKFYQDKIEKWQKRSVLTIDECKDCPINVICGGGCAVIANDRNGDILSPNCKPIKEVMDIGINFYKDKLI